MFWALFLEDQNLRYRHHVLFFYCTEIDTGKIKVLMDENQKNKKKKKKNF